MSELINLLNDNQQKLGKILQSTAADLWGGTQDIWSAPKTAGGRTPATPKQEEKTVRVKENTPVDQLWKVADEVIDWTEVLAYEHSSDGLTSERLWSFYRKHATRVLQGDLAAYVEVLKTCNPLGDMTPYATGIQIRTPSADRLEVRFDCMTDQLTQNRDQYLYGLCLRMARDLFATLPVTEVGVEAWSEGQKLLQVDYTKEQLRKQNFRFLDPVAFAQK